MQSITTTLPMTLEETCRNELMLVAVVDENQEDLDDDVDEAIHS